jgi:hypothetical protein
MDANHSLGAMSTAELIYERAKLLSETEAQSVLKHMVTLNGCAGLPLEPRTRVDQAAVAPD